MDNNNKELMIKPIETPNQPSNNITPINNITPTPSNQPNNFQNDEIINKLPDWNIEPPIEIRRGNE